MTTTDDLDFSLGVTSPNGPPASAAPRGPLVTCACGGKSRAGGLCAYCHRYLEAPVADLEAPIAEPHRNVDRITAELARASLPALVIQLAHAEGRYCALTELLETRDRATRRGPGLDRVAMDILRDAANAALTDYRAIRAAYVAAGGDVGDACCALVDA